MPDITVHNNGESVTIPAAKDITLLELLKRNGFFIESPCNGRGNCGKCRIKINNKEHSYTKDEKKILSAEEMQIGIHLACMCRIKENMEITLMQQTRNASIQTDAYVPVVSGTPVAEKIYLELSPASISDQVSDEDRICMELENYKPENGRICHTPFRKDSMKNPFDRLPIRVLLDAPEIIRQNAFKVTIVDIMGKITGIESGNSTQILYGVAVDIGTTTLAAYLYDLKAGKQLSVSSSLNPQNKHGADVISRIDYASKSDSHRLEMSGLIHNALSELILKLCSVSGIKPSDIYLVTLAGNTTMMHLFMGIPSMNIAIAPFIPVTLSGHILYPPEVGLPISKFGGAVVLPSVSAYIGADTVSAVLSTGMHLKEALSLLIDIGTNGEIVLGNESSLYACSTAAGPAFEGASISCGMGGLNGAISRMRILPDGNLEIKTIGEESPVGICGSGLIDAIACMLEIGIIDETGRILSIEELDENAYRYRTKLIEINEQPAFILVSSVDSFNCKEIVITQKDVREVQNAKAAIAAGIQVITRVAGYRLQDIQTIYLAGGFGSFIQIDSAITVGLLPRDLSGRITAIGNAAGAGAINALLSGEELLQTDIIAKKVKYLELSSNPDFVQEYTDNMFFEIN